MNRNADLFRKHLLLINKGILWSFGWNNHLLNWDHWTRLQIWTSKVQQGVLAVLWPSRCPFTFSCSFTYIGYLAPELSYFLLWEGEVCFHVILFFFFFWCRPFLKSFWICYNISCALCFGFFGHEACGILVPRSGAEHTTSAFEGKVLTTRLPEKFPHAVLLLLLFFF